MVRTKAFRNRFLDPKVLAGASNLQLIAKHVVEGFVAGLHRSPYHGFSLEFSEYREYSPGDDIRHVDWKVYGRTDRFFVKKFEGDTNTQVFILVDCSRSMTFGSGPVSKLDYARFLAASLAYFSVRQNDAVGLIDFDTRIRKLTPPRSTHGHLLTLLHHLEGMEEGKETQIRSVLEELTSLVTKRSLVVLISDFYEDPAAVGRALRFFHHRGNDVLVFHVLDPLELELTLDATTTLQDMETGEQLPFDTEHSREAYLEKLRDHTEALKRECLNAEIDYELLNCSKPLDQALFRYLSNRSRRI